MRQAFLACEAARLLVRTARSGEGGLKGFNEFHVLQALRMMASGPVGRPRLVRMLGIGEASAKTMLKVLREEGLARKCGVAHCITGLGVEVVNALSGLCIAGPGIAGLGGALDRITVILVPQLDPPRDVVGVYNIRDYLVARECRPVLVGSFWPPRTLRFPGMPEELESSLVGRVIKEIEAGKCDVDIDAATVIVAPYECGTRAAAAVIEALADSCRSPRDSVH